MSASHVSLPCLDVLAKHPWVAYAGPFPFPSGTPSAQRVKGVAQAIASEGLGVLVLAGYAPMESITEFIPAFALPGSIHYAGAAEYGRASPLTKLANLLWRGGRNTLAWLQSQKSLPKAVIAYSPVLSHWRRLRRWTQAHGIPLIADLADWYAPQQMQGGGLGPPYWAQQYTYRRQLRSADGIMGISSYVCDYYSRRGLQTLNVPPLVDVRSMPQREETDLSGSRVRLVYAGFPDRKDLLGVVLDAMQRVDPDGTQFEIDILGPKPDYVAQQWPSANRSNVRVHGRLQHDLVMHRVREADFSVLVRPDALYAKVGFPTKVVESLALGTPVLANLVGDLGHYLEDGANAVVAASPTVASLVTALQRCAQMRAQWPAMRQAAHATAERYFDFRAHAHSIARFIHQLGHRQPPSC